MSAFGADHVDPVEDVKVSGTNLGEIEKTIISSLTRVARKTPRFRCEDFALFTREQYDSRAFETLEYNEREWEVLKLSRDARSFYDTIERNKSEVPSTRVYSIPRAPTSIFPQKVRGALVVEDSSVQMKLVCRSLASIGLMMGEKWIFFEATSGEFALKIWQGLNIDMIFVDQNLSADGIKGDQIIKEIRKTARTKKLLLIGVISNPMGASLLASAGADLVYIKPLTAQPKALKSLIGAVQSISLY